MTVSRQTEEQVRQTLDRLIETIRAGDPQSLEALIAPECSGFFAGRESPYCEGSEFVASPPQPFTLHGCRVHAVGTIAWVTARMTLDANPSRPGRFTAVLRGTGHAWMISQIHGSLSV
jgi:ketosteroid isomerase-like protein